jgi:GNAT superfamily N-acetyltransferase
MSSGAEEQHTRRRFATAWKLWLQNGLLSLVREGIRQSTHPFLNVYDVFLADLTRPPATEKPMPEFTVRLYRGPEQCAAATQQLTLLEIPLHEVCRRMRNGDLVAIGSVGRDVVGYTWMTFTEVEMPEIGRFLRIPPNHAVQFDTFIAPRWRGQGLQFLLNVPVLEYARQQGIVYTLAWVNRLNVRSRRNQLRTQKKEVLTIVSVRLPGTRRVWNWQFGAPDYSSLIYKTALPQCAAVSSV